MRLNVMKIWERSLNMKSMVQTVEIYCNRQIAQNKNVFLTYFISASSADILI